MEKELQLQPRLQCIASLVPQGARLADVGTDHGYLPVWLLQHGRIESAIASDINALPLDHARATAREYGVTERMDFRLCPGLAKIRTEECDAIAIAGMGGETILGILEAAPWTRDGAHTLILQPQTKVDLLRRWLCESGYRFLEEKLVRDKEQLYVVFRVTGGDKRRVSEADALTGFLLGDDPLYGEYLAQHLAKLRRAAQGLAVSSLSDRDARIAHLQQLIEELERREREWAHGNGT
mgnify:CR=1 FL=1